MRAAVVIDGEELVFTAHALERWQERCRPALGLVDAKDDLVRIAKKHATVGRDAPAWMDRETLADLPEREQRWLMIGEDVAFPVTGRSVTTCIPRGSLSEKTRKARQERRAKHSNLRKVIRQSGGAEKPHRRGAGSRKKKPKQDRRVPDIEFGRGGGGRGRRDEAR